MKSILRYIAGRLGACIASLAVLSFVIFSLLYLAPGDPARNLVGTKKVTPELLDRIRASYHLDDPFFSQFWRWIKNAISGDFGKSIRTGQDVVTYTAQHAPQTLQLVFMALVLSIGIGILLGVVSAKSHGKLRDRVIDVGALVGGSAPSFAMGLLLLYVFSYKLAVFPFHGIDGSDFIRNLPYLILPALALTIAISAMLIKITRSALLLELTKDYTTFMRARSISPMRITMSQLRNASSPILASTGLLLANLFGSTILVENVFSIPGLGSLLASAVVFHDVPTVQYIALMLAGFICVASALVDIITYIINPQARAGKRRLGQ